MEKNKINKIFGFIDNLFNNLLFYLWITAAIIIMLMGIYNIKNVFYTEWVCLELLVSSFIYCFGFLMIDDNLSIKYYKLERILEYIGKGMWLITVIVAIGEVIYKTWQGS